MKRDLAFNALQFSPKFGRGPFGLADYVILKRVGGPRKADQCYRDCAPELEELEYF
jgi:hypothetical protein